ncbi:TonB-dependent receptor [Skermanella mucosa]|uniref:TonB-dependent receptor plug domain-containing protein n=1 Tax=Skermanella mucosa TaxID=1789672 RepID=UPI00192BFB8D|nr:TonB-dependent receptor plug domain-containing protein [Skermanella mucosa]UEM23593.1 TonB-dependent receptor [Skermanella mucosa]
MKTLFPLASIGIALALTATGSATAQTINYGELEALFKEPVTTSATGKPQRQTEVPVTMDIITAEDIRRSGANDIPEILRNVAGVDVWRWTNGATDVGVRGYNQAASPRLLVLVNGRQVYLDHYGVTTWNAIPVELSEIRQIEVVKGPNSALFGFNAVAGVINIITFSPLYDDVNTATLRGGTQKYRQVSLVNTLKAGDRAGLKISAGASDADEFDTDASALEDRLRRGPERRSLSLDGLVQVTDDMQWGVELTRSHLEYTDTLSIYTPSRATTDTYSARTSLTGESGWGLWEASIYRNWLEADLDSGGVSSDLPITNSVTVAKLQDLFKVGADHSFRISGEYRHNTMEVVPHKEATVSYDVYSAGGMWDWSVSKSVSLTNAVRVDHLRLDRSGPVTLANFPSATGPFTNDDYDKNLTEYSFNSSLAWRPTKLDTVRVMASRGVQLPSMLAFGYHDGFPPNPGSPLPIYSRISGSPDIDPMSVMNYELGYDRQIPQIDALARFSLYRQTSKNLIGDVDPTRISSIDFNTFPIPVDFLFGNVGSSDATGLEVGMDGRIGTAWRWGLNYAFEIVDDDLVAAYNDGNPTAVAFEDSTPRHKVNGRIGYTRGGFEADLFANYVSGYRVPQYQPGAGMWGLADVEDRITLSGRVGYHLNDIITVAVEGLSFNQTSHRETSLPEVERRLYFSVRADY